MAANRRMMQLAADQSSVDTRKGLANPAGGSGPRGGRRIGSRRGRVPAPAPAVVAASAPAAMDTTADVSGQTYLHGHGGYIFY